MHTGTQRHIHFGRLFWENWKIGTTALHLWSWKQQHHRWYWKTTTAAAIINDEFLKEANFIFLDYYIILESVPMPNVFSTPCQDAALQYSGQFSAFTGFIPSAPFLTVLWTSPPRGTDCHCIPTLGNHSGVWTKKLPWLHNYLIGLSIWPRQPALKHSDKDLTNRSSHVGFCFALFYS